MLKSKKITSITITYMGVVLPLVAFAQLPESPIQSLTDVQVVMNNIAAWLSAFFFTIAIIFIILAAFQYLTAGGDDEKIKKAHRQLIFAIVAIVITFLATGFQSIIFSLLAGEVPIP